MSCLLRMEAPTSASYLRRKAAQNYCRARPQSTALRERMRTVKDELLANRMRRLADDMACLFVETRLAGIVEEVRA